MTNWEKITYKVNNTERGAYCAISNSIAIKKEPKHRAGLQRRNTKGFINTGEVAQSCS